MTVMCNTNKLLNNPAVLSNVVKHEAPHVFGAYVTYNLKSDHQRQKEDQNTQIKQRVKGETIHRIKRWVSI